ncbi:penicillin-binding protein [Paenibacillus sp. AR247]|nr:penicillin-binding protein [Paenibacillus sp. AR247]
MPAEGYTEWKRHKEGFFLSVKHKRRIFYVLVILSFMMTVLILRLAYIQLVMRVSELPGSRFTMQEMSVLQRERGVVLDSGRGKFYDRNGEPLTGKTVSAAVLFPVSGSIRQEAKDKLNAVTRVLKTDQAAFLKVWDHLSVPLVWPDSRKSVPLALKDSEAKQVRTAGISGIEVLPYTKRYEDASSGMQWLGYLTEQPGQKHLIHTGYAFQEGAAGLEKTLEPLLRGMGPTTAYYTVDGSDQPIPGTGIRIKGPGNAYYPLKFRTTVDLELQRQIEQLAKESGMKEGAVVLLDAQTADVVAMVSLPFYNPLDVNPQQRAWNNRALQAAVPGSIFKTVIAAAALEAGVTSPDETFTCTGAYGKYGLSCPKEHGVITLAEAYAESCNAVFAELAERLSAGEIEAAAHKLGLARTVGWEEKDILGLPLLRPFDHEDSGKIFADPDKADRDGGIRAQTGIGQRDVQVTPLQAANMIVTLLQQGQVHAPRILESVSYANGQLMKELKPHLAPSSLGTVQPATADLITGWMEKVVTEGTGQSIRGAAWPLAGKSGTAQVTINGQPRNHQWFIGYGPVNQPKYAAAVLYQNMSPSSRNQATVLFGRIMNLLAAHPAA